MYRQLTIIAIIGCCLPGGGYLPAQQPQQIQGTTVAARVVGEDTLPVIELKGVDVVAARQFSNRLERFRYNRLVHNVKVVYPYARLAGNKFHEYSEALSQMDSERERRHFIRQAEQEIRDQFEDELRRLTISQGLILIKLIDRETNHTSYQVLKEFRGIFSAVFWQSLGRLFGYNLRTEYDAFGEDQLIEEIVELIEAGFI